MMLQTGDRFFISSKEKEEEESFLPSTTTIAAVDCSQPPSVCPSVELRAEERGGGAKTTTLREKRERETFLFFFFFFFFFFWSSLCGSFLVGEAKSLIFRVSFSSLQWTCCKEGKAMQRKKEQNSRISFARSLCTLCCTMYVLVQKNL